VAGLVTFFFVVACFLPTIRMGSDGYRPGIFCLLFGCITCFFWMPNPLLFVGCRALLSGYNRFAFRLGVVACVCTLPLLGMRDARSDLSVGYYVWQADIFLFTVASGVLWNRFGARVRSPGPRPTD
jgi:hypothetical protein